MNGNESIYPKCKCFLIFIPINYNLIIEKWSLINRIIEQDEATPTVIVCNQKLSVITIKTNYEYYLVNSKIFKNKLKNNVTLIIINKQINKLVWVYSHKIVIYLDIPLLDNN